MKFIKSVGILLLFVCQEINAVNEFTANATEEIKVKLFPSPVNGVEKKVDPRIVGGTKAIKGQFRGIVSIQSMDGDHFCGGTLYENTEKKTAFVLTAAHCMKIGEDLVNPKAIQIVGDDLNNRIWSTDISRQIRRVKSIIIHPEYISTRRTILNDIAIIVLARPFEVTESFGPVSLPEYDVYDNQSCSVAGWGTLYSGANETPVELYAVDINIIPKNICTPPHNNEHDIGPSVICAGSMSGAKDSCQGDSGGGLICDNRLAGLVSWGIDCGRENFPGLYTNVYDYRDWIEANSSNSFNPMVSLLISSFGILILNLIFY